MRDVAVVVVSIRVIVDGPGVPEDIEPYLFSRHLHGGGRALLSGSIGLGTAVAAAYAESFGGMDRVLPGGRSHHFRGPPPSSGLAPRTRTRVAS